MPAVISSQGVYCLTGNVSTSNPAGNAIEITANNVTLDLNSWKVGGQAAGTATLATGIYSTANNVVIKNGIVRGFYMGIRLTGRGATVEGLLVDKNTYTGIQVEGQGSLLRDNRIVDTGGSTATTDEDAFGIAVGGAESVIDGNLISGLTATGTGQEWGIYVWSNGDYATLRNNVISDAVSPAGGGYSAGIRMGNTSWVGVEGSTVINMDYGIYFFGSSTGTYSRNTAINCTNPFIGGTAGAGNSP